MTDLIPLEELLSRSVPSPSENYAANLRSLALRAYDRHHEPVRFMQFSFHGQQILSWASALALAIFAFFALTTTGRALAQQIFQLGLFIFTNGPSAAETYLTATPEISSIPSVVRVGLAEASGIAGFPVYYPTYLPEGYTPLSHGSGHQVEVLFNSAGGVVRVNATFEETENGKMLTFSQIPMDPAATTPPFHFGTGQVESKYVKVGGNEGVWLQDFP